VLVSRFGPYHQLAEHLAGYPPSGKWPTRSSSPTCPAAFWNRSGGCSSAP
jgi:hypothetical protein